MPVQDHGREIYNAYVALKMRERHQRRKKQAVTYKGGQCEACGYDRCLDALEFHHQDPDQKDLGIGTSQRLPWPKVKAELDKCRLLCANCHREEHHHIVSERHDQLLVEVRQHVPERPPSQGVVVKICEGCGEPFQSRVSANQRFCSRKCRWLKPPGPVG